MEIAMIYPGIRLFPMDIPMVLTPNFPTKTCKNWNDTHSKCKMVHLNMATWRGVRDPPNNGTLEPGVSGVDVANHPRGCCWTPGVKKSVKHTVVGWLLDCLFSDWMMLCFFTGMVLTF